MIELDLYFRLNNKFIFGPDLSVKNSWWTFRKWGSTFEACWKLNDIRHCTTINVFRRDSSSPGSPTISLHYSFKPKKSVPHLIHCTRDTCTQQPLACLTNLFSVMLRLHTAINRADFVSWWMWFNASHTEITTALNSVIFWQMHFVTFCTSITSTKIRNRPD